MKTPFRKEMPRAYRGDTYIEDCLESAKSGPAWTKAFLLFAIAASMADFYFINDLTGMAVGTSSTNPMCILVAVVLSFGMFFCARALGNASRHYIAFGGSGYKAVVVMAVAGLVLILVGVTVFRYSAEAADAANQALAQASSVTHSAIGSSSAGTVVKADPIAVTALQTIAMLISALTSFIYAFFSRDAVRERIYEDALGSYESDKDAYARAWNESYLSPKDEEGLEGDERAFDRKVKSCKADVFKLCTRLSAIVDPADAAEVMKVSEWAANWSPLKIESTKEVLENEAA